MFRAAIASVLAAVLASTPWPVQQGGGDIIKTLKVGIIGLDTSHVTAFTKILNNPKNLGDLRGFKVVAAYPGGSPDVASSRDRIGGFTKQIKETYGVEIVASIDDLLKKVDVVLLESVDGRPHLEQARPVILAGKPLFIDKPMSASLVDVLKIFALAKKHQVPCFSSSSLRFDPAIAALKNDSKIGAVVGVDVFGPCSLEEHHPDLMWYGVHTVEMLYALMGTGCEKVTRTQTKGTDAVTGVWNGGKIGTFRGIREGKSEYGATVFGTKGLARKTSSGGYEPLVAAIAKFFRTGQPPVSADETIEMFTFMEAADESKRRGGAPVSMAAVLAKAAALAQDKVQPTKGGKDAGPVKTGLHLNNPKAFRGYTLFAPLNSSKYYLIDMEGKVARSWEGASTPASCAMLLENGHLLRPCVYDAKKTAFGTGGGGGGRVQEFTWEGELVWDFQVANDKQLSHHDVRKLPNGNLLMIVGEMKNAEEVAAVGRKAATNVRSDCLIEVRPTGKTSGEVVWQWHMWDHLIQDHDKFKANFGDVAAHPELIDVNLGPAGKAPKAGAPPAKGGLDWTHTNSVDYNADLDQILLSVHNFSEVWIIDHSTTAAEAAGHSGGKTGKGGDILYRWGNPRAYRAGTAADQQLFVQHNAQWIAKGLPGQGHILVFNNGTNRPGGNFSSVDEFIPPVDAKGNYTYKPGSSYGPAKALWSYTAPKKADFYSSYISGAQRLPNGNTLICQGADGTFFEVTSGKDVVWKYVNPIRGKPAKGGGAPTAGAVFRAFRYAPDYPGLSGRVLNPTMTIDELLSKELPKKE